MELVAWLTRFAEGGRFAVEALGCNRWLVNALLADGMDIIVVDATKLDSKKYGKKTDRRDAHEIARRLWLGDLDRFAKAYFPTDEEFGHRKLLRVRHGQLRKRTRTIAQIRAILNAYLLRPTSSVLWTWKSIAWLRKQSLPSEELEFAFQILVDDLESVQRQILARDKRIKHLANKDEVTRIMMSVLPSMGPQTSLKMIAELGDARRFKNARAVASYGGVVPRVAQSADSAHHGRVTKRGNSGLRWIMGDRCVGHAHAGRGVLARALPGARRIASTSPHDRTTFTWRFSFGIQPGARSGGLLSLELEVAKVRRFRTPLLTPSDKGAKEEKKSRTTEGC